MTLLVLPLESLPAALTVKGAGGEKQPGRTPTLVLALSGWLLPRKAARALCGLLIHEPPRSSWTTRPQPQARRSWSWSSWSVMKNNLRRLRRQSLQPNSRAAPNPTARAKPNSPRAKGPRAQEPRREPGGRRQQGRTPLRVRTKAGWMPPRRAARQMRGSPNQEPPRSSLICCS